MDAETQAVVSRVNEKILWAVAWLWCIFGSIFTLIAVVKRWNSWTSDGRFLAGLLVAGIVMVPTTLILKLKKGQPISSSWLVMSAYVLLFLSVIAFGVNFR